MNIVLDSPLEALAFDYVSFGILTFVNNLWAWVALITAAVSFWRIRAAGAGGIASCSVYSQPLSSVNCICHHDDEDESRPVFETFSSESTTQPSPSPSPSSPASVPAISGSSVFLDNGITKGKFVVYYEDDRESESNGDGDDSEITVVGEWGNGSDYKEWSESWERVLRMRMGDLGWYRYQDLTAINGNVVRLWDGVRRRNYDSICVVW